jgi:hypothetical protein
MRPHLEEDPTWPVLCAFQFLPEQGKIARGASRGQESSNLRQLASRQRSSPRIQSKSALSAPGLVSTAGCVAAVLAAADRCEEQEGTAAWAMAQASMGDLSRQCRASLQPLPAGPPGLPWRR